MEKLTTAIKSVRTKLPGTDADFVYTNTTTSEVNGNCTFLSDIKCLPLSFNNSVTHLPKIKILYHRQSMRQATSKF